MSKIKNGALDQYGAGPFKQQQFRTAGVKGASCINVTTKIFSYLLCNLLYVLLSHRLTPKRRSCRPTVTTTLVSLGNDNASLCHLSSM